MRQPGRRVQHFRIYFPNLHLSREFGPDGISEAQLCSRRVRRFVEDNFVHEQDYWIAQSGNMYYFQSREHVSRVFREFEYDAWYIEACILIAEWHTRTAQWWDVQRYVRLKTGSACLLQKLSA